MNSAEAVFTNLVCVARADRKIDDAEDDTLEHYRQALGLDPAVARRILKKKRLRPVRPDEDQAFQSESLAHLKMMVRVATSDGEINPREERLLQEVAKSLGIGPLQLAEVKVSTSAHVKTRRKVRIAKLIGAGVAVLAITLTVWAVNSSNRESEQSESRMFNRIADVEDSFDRVSRDHAEAAVKKVETARHRYEEFEAGLRSRFEALSRDVAQSRKRAAELKTVREQLERLESTSAASTESAAAIKDLREQIVSWSENDAEREKTRSELALLKEALVRVESVQRSFQQAIEEGGESVVILLVYYRLRRGKDTMNSGSSGTGFFVTPDGLLVTNKHVVEPWKFRARDRKLIADGWKPDPEGYSITAWPAGSEVLDDRRIYRMDLGMSTRNQKMRLIAKAPDRWVEREAESGEEVKFRGRFHTIDERDLALLEAKVEAPVRLLPISTDEAAIRALDPVMVLGFPKGFNLFEGRVANTAPSLGRVRKLERSLWVTAPIVKGNSGGPILDGKGRIVAVAYKGYPGTDTLGAGIPIRHALDLLPGGKELLKRGKRAFEKGQWRAARSLADLTALRQPSLGEGVSALKAKVESRRREALGKVLALTKKGEIEEAEKLKRSIDEEFGVPETP